MKSYLYVGLLSAALISCGPQQQPQRPANNVEAPVLPTPNAPPEVANSATPAPGVQNNPPQTSLPEPKGPIDPRSVEAAGQVIQHYGALIEQKRWAEAWTLWSNIASAKAFDRNWRDDSEVHLEIGDLGQTEGAAGSIYTTVPVTFYGKTNAGGSFRRPANIILRRVNDVPGSTAAQRRWHIERIEWKAGA